MKEGKIVFMMGVSGSGKSTVINHLLNNPKCEYINSYTTRPPRENETPGTRYNFVTQEVFDVMIQQSEFLEYAKVHESFWYGTKLSEILKSLSDGKIVLKEIDVQGLINIKQSGRIEGKYISLFLDLPEEVMIQRITSRAPIAEDELNQRLASASKERILAHQSCDFFVSGNQPVEKVFADVENVLKPYLDN